MVKFFWRLQTGGQLPDASNEFKKQTAFELMELMGDFQFDNLARQPSPVPENAQLIKQIMFKKIPDAVKAEDLKFMVNLHTYMQGISAKNAKKMFFRFLKDAGLPTTKQAFRIARVPSPFVEITAVHMGIFPYFWDIASQEDIVYLREIVAYYMPSMTEGVDAEAPLRFRLHMQQFTKESFHKIIYVKGNEEHSAAKLISTYRPMEHSGIFGESVKENREIGVNRERRWKPVNVLAKTLPRPGSNAETTSASPDLRKKIDFKTSDKSINRLASRLSKSSLDETPRDDSAGDYSNPGNVRGDENETIKRGDDAGDKNDAPSSNETDYSTDVTPTAFDDNNSISDDINNDNNDDSDDNNNNNNDNDDDNNDSDNNNNDSSDNDTDNNNNNDNSDNNNDNSDNDTDNNNDTTNNNNNDSDDDNNNDTTTNNNNNNDSDDNDNNDNSESEHDITDGEHNDASSVGTDESGGDEDGGDSDEVSDGNNATDNGKDNLNKNGKPSLQKRGVSLFSKMESGGLGIKSLLADYEWKDLLGMGGYGVVFLVSPKSRKAAAALSAYDKWNNRKYAMKIHNVTPRNGAQKHYSSANDPISELRVMYIINRSICRTDRMGDHRESRTSALPIVSNVVQLYDWKWLESDGDELIASDIFKNADPEDVKSLDETIRFWASSDSGTSYFQFLLLEYCPLGSIKTSLYQNRLGPGGPVHIMGLLQPHFFSSFMVQILCTLHTLEESFRFTHYDLTLSNILMREYDATPKHKVLCYRVAYEAKIVSFYSDLHECNDIIFKISDFGMSSVQVADEERPRSDMFPALGKVVITDIPRHMAYQPFIDIHKLGADILYELVQYYNYRMAVDEADNVDFDVETIDPGVIKVLIEMLAKNWESSGGAVPAWGNRKPYWAAAYEKVGIYFLLARLFLTSILDGSRSIYFNGQTYSRKHVAGMIDNFAQKNVVLNDVGQEIKYHVNHEIPPTPSSMTPKKLLSHSFFRRARTYRFSDDSREERVLFPMDQFFNPDLSDAAFRNSENYVAASNKKTRRCFKRGGR